MALLTYSETEARTALLSDQCPSDSALLKPSTGSVQYAQPGAAYGGRLCYPKSLPTDD